MSTFFSALRKDNAGATMVEFALLAPVIFGMFLGVLQVGIGMQAYNALRNISADASRYTVVEYQRENDITTTEIETKTKSIASAMPYGLESTRFQARVTRPSTQRVSDAIEYSIEVSYNIRSVIPFFGLEDIPISFTRPIFVIDTTV